MLVRQRLGVAAIHRDPAAVDRRRRRRGRPATIRRRRQKPVRVERKVALVLVLVLVLDPAKDRRIIQIIQNLEVNYYKTNK